MKRDRISNAKYADREVAKAKHTKELETDKGVADDFNTVYNRGASKYKLGDDKGAIDDFNEAIELDPFNADAYYCRGIIKRNLGDYEGSINDFGKVIKLDPDNATAYHNRGASKHKLGDYDGAVDDFNKTIELDPSNTAAYYNKGISKGELGDYKGAIADFNVAIELDPNHVASYYNRGNMKGKLNNSEGAIDDYSAAIELDPDDMVAYHNRGITNGELGNYESAIDDFNKMIELDPSNATAYYCRGVSKHKLGDDKGAIDDFNKAKELKSGVQSKMTNNLKRVKSQRAKSKEEHNTSKSEQVILSEGGEVKKQSKEPGDTFRGCENCPEMVVVPAGGFMMGSARGRGHSEEWPQHRVTISEAFAVGKYAVTRGQFAAFVDATGYGAGTNWRNPGFEQSDTHPVVYVSWNGAKAYTRWLSEKTGRQYRLLSEAEWEYAARAGTITRYHFGDTIDPSQANYARNNGGTVVVGSYPANDFGLYDMHGNVWEWVEDCWHNHYEGAPTDGSAWVSDRNDNHVLRGGSWINGPGNLRSADRLGFEAGDRKSISGFRVARTL